MVDSLEGGGAKILQKTMAPCMGRPQDLAGEGPRILFQIRKFACRKAICALLGGFGDMPLREKNFEWCNLVRNFGVYFDQILSLKFILNYHFLYKNF